MCEESNGQLYLGVNLVNGSSHRMIGEYTRDQPDTYTAPVDLAPKTRTQEQFSTGLSAVPAGQIDFWFEWQGHDAGDTARVAHHVRYDAHDCDDPDAPWSQVGEAYAYEGSDGGGSDPAVATETYAGADRYETPILASRSHFGVADTVVIATGLNFPDALAGGPLATHLDAPLLLNPPDQLHQGVADELDRLGARTAVLLGGISAIGPTVEADLRQRGIDVERIAGADRYETATLIARRLPTPDRVYLSSGLNFPDALAASVPAARQRVPVLLTTSDSLPEPTADLLTAWAPTVQQVMVTGGPQAVASAVEAQAARMADADSARLAGQDRYETAALIAEHDREFVGVVQEIHIATGQNFPDALASAPIAGRGARSLVLVHGQDPEAGAAAYDQIRRIRDQAANDTVEKVVFYGGPGALHPTVRDQVMMSAS